MPRINPANLDLTEFDMSVLSYSTQPTGQQVFSTKHAMSIIEWFFWAICPTTGLPLG
jgi:hypothetical protein